MVEVTTNGGTSWRKTDPGLTAIVRLSATSDGEVFAIGADDQCRPTYARSAGPKEKWKRDRDRVENVWFRTPKEPDQVHAPGGGESRPCGDDLRDLAGLGTYQAAVLCGDGRIRTEAQGRSWKTVRENSGVLALNADDDEFVAAVRRRNCAGIVVQRFNSGGVGLGNPGSCRANVKFVANKVAVSQLSSDQWLWSGDSISIS